MEGAQPKEVKKLYRSGENRVLSGVCGGIGEYFEIDPVIIRLIWVILTIVSLGIGGILAYILAILLMPKNPKHRWI